jgi:hypothetical protein
MGGSLFLSGSGCISVSVEGFFEKLLRIVLSLCFKIFYFSGFSDLVQSIVLVYL